MPYIKYKEMLEFGPKEYEAIDKHCQLHRLEWFASPWDVDSVHFLEQWKCPYIKVASACLTNHELLEAIRSMDIPIIVSTGLADQEIFMEAWDIIRPNVEYVLACTGTYPSLPQEQNLSFIRTLKHQFGKAAKVGFSNHNPGILYAAAAVCYGAEMIECHITLDRAMWGSDQSASIEPEGMHKLTKYVAGLQEAIGGGDWKYYEREKQVAAKLRKA
jgi:sialic acid synthase SpsE